MSYPAAPRQRLVETLHGHQVADPYRWLEDAGSPATKAWLRQEETLNNAEKAKYSATTAELAARLSQMYSVGHRAPGRIRGSREFFWQRAAGDDQRKLWVRDPDGSERLLLDASAIRADGTAKIDGTVPSPDGRLLAYWLSFDGNEESSLYIMDVATQRILEGPIDRTRYSGLTWTRDSRAYYYGRRLAPEAVAAGEDKFHRRVYFHKLGDDHDKDAMVFGDGRDKLNYYGTSLSPDGRWLIVSESKGWSGNNLYIADLHGDGKFRAIQEGVAANTSAWVGDDGKLYIFTDRGAPRGKLAVADPARPTARYWKPLIRQSADKVLSDFVFTKDRIVVAWTKDAVSSVSVYDRATGNHMSDVKLPGTGEVALSTSTLHDTDEVLIDYSNFVTRGDSYVYDAVTESMRIAVPQQGQLSFPDLAVEQVHVTSKDGTDVPMFVIHRKDVVLDGKNPTILYGYGGFNSAMGPSWNPAATAWVQAGGVYAVANLRGGSERGEDWHRAGMRENKQNVFDDFIAASEWLIAQKYTNREHLGISGGSNGGLLVAAALTQRPELYAAVDMAVPLTDMLRYEQFLIGRQWNQEYGSADIAEEFEWLLAYSPYHHVRKGVAYPAVRIFSGDNDARTDPAHARKMAAALQWATSSAKPVILARDTKSGHQGSASISQWVAATAERFGFMASQLGLGLQAGQHDVDGRQIA